MIQKRKTHPPTHLLTESFCELSWNPHCMAGPVLRAQKSPAWKVDSNKQPQQQRGRGTCLTLRFGPVTLSGKITGLVSCEPASEVCSDIPRYLCVPQMAPCLNSLVSLHFRIQDHPFTECQKTTSSATPKPLSLIPLTELKRLQNIFMFIICWQDRQFCPHFIHEDINQPVASHFFLLTCQVFI